MYMGLISILQTVCKLQDAGECSKSVHQRICVKKSLALEQGRKIRVLEVMMSRIGDPSFFARFPAGKIHVTHRNISALQTRRAFGGVR